MTNMNSVIGDASWMLGLERNSDIVKMHCYAPLFANINKGAFQWGWNLIGYDALNSFELVAFPYSITVLILKAK